LGHADFYYKSFLKIFLAVLGFIFVVFFGLIIVKAIPGFRFEGWSFFTTANWIAPESFGALQLILATLVTTLMALCVAVPIGIGAAVAIVYLVPKSLKILVSSIVGILASVPSIIYGVWGVFVIVHFSGYHLEPWLASVFHGHWPATGAPRAFGILAGGIVLSVMILPIVIAVGASVLETVPEETTEAAYALGSTKSRVIRKVILPRARGGLTGAVLLGTARALGETIALATILGSASTGQLPFNLFATGGTLASSIATDFSGFAEPTFEMLLCLGVCLIVITFTTGAIGRNLVAKQARRYL